MVDRITEVLEDGTVYCFDIDKCNDIADKTLDELYKKQDVEIDFDYTATVFSLFVHAVHILTNSGWTTHDLIEEVIDHSEAVDIDDYKDPENQ